MAKDSVVKFYVAPNGFAPSIAKSGDAGIDLKYKGKKIELRDDIVYKLHTGVYVEIPEGKCGIIFERSGLGSRHGIIIHGRIIDSGYRGEIMILMSQRHVAKTLDSDKIISDEDNNWNKAEHCSKLIINNGDKIAQMVVVDFCSQLQQVAKLEDLSSSERGATGLGSSGR